MEKNTNMIFLLKKSFDKYKDIIKTQIKDSGIKWYCLFISDSSYWINKVNKNMFIRSFLNEKDLISFVKENIKWENIFYSNTARNTKLLNELKKNSWQKVTDNDKLFLSKDLQRKLLLKFDKDITINYKTYNNVTELKLNKKDIFDNFDFPFIIKPSTWTTSAWVSIINNEEDFNNTLIILKETLKKINKKFNIKNPLVIEEFIDGQMYTIDYFVDENQKIYLTKPVKTFTVKDEYWIEDFWITKEILWKSIEEELNENELETFIKKNVKACGIRNTFVHHEFKKTTKWYLKTIEMNWRLWWFRTNMYKNAYNIIPLEFLFNKNIKPKFKQYYMFVWLFPIKETELLYNWLNKNFINKIKKLPSFLNINSGKNNIWHKIGLTKNWYKFFWSVELVNKDIEQLEKDYTFIKNNLQKNIKYDKNKKK